MLGAKSQQHAGWSSTKAAVRGARLLLEIKSKGLVGADTSNFFERQVNRVILSRAKDAEKDQPVSLWKQFCRSIVASAWFKYAILGTIFCNCITIAIDVSVPENANGVTYIFDVVFLAIYIAEFFLKVFADATAYFQSNYNRFDFILLLFSVAQFCLVFFPDVSSNLSFIRIFRSIRAIRSIRSVSSIRKLKIIVNALIRTMRTDVIDIVLCLFVFMFLFAVMGYYLFGSESTGASPQFASLPMALLTLLDYVTSSNWSTDQFALRDLGFSGSELYGIAFMFIGNFVFPNMFIGLICQNISDAETEDRERIQALRSEKQRQKKAAFQAKVQEDMRRLLEQQGTAKDQDMQRLLESLAGKLRHDEIMPMTTMICNSVWLETFMVTQYHLEHAMYRTQQAHFRVALVLAEIMARMRQQQRQH